MYQIYGMMFVIAGIPLCSVMKFQLKNKDIFLVGITVFIFGRGWWGLLCQQE